MKPEIHLLGVSIKTFGLCFAFAFLASGAVVSRRLVELGRSAEWAYEMVFAAAVGGLVGSRLYYLIQNYNDVKHDLLGNIFSGAGLVWYGGALGGALGVCLWAYRRGFLGLTLLDVCAPALALGYAVGRVGCQVSGDGDYGKAWNGPWAMAYPNGTVPTTVKVHPTPIYETLTMGLAAWALWRARNAFRPGVLFACYLILAGSERFLVEFLRRNDAVAAGLTAPQFESLAMLLAGLLWVGLAARRGGLRPVSVYAPTS
ncbi:MAG: phosphatidylglycerol---prolipoprotein diacylglyceryl transferase [Solirubrobacteraceae bacterium]|jgi:phosphatidylglycerol:prolipoprotein diacylglycerol transferase|nr:phosphatidylglycerol---prolipoprotein diacylglyceryl transferase [Solirubrobacteraceae bacterium]